MNPTAAMTLVLVFPARTFARLRERPHWILPLVFAAGAALVSMFYTARAGVLDEFFRGAAIAAGTGIDEVRSGFLTASVLTAAVVVPLATIVDALLFMVVGWFLGGSARFRTAFGAVAYASIPSGIGSLFFAGLVALTGSVRVGANLGVLLDAALHPTLWGFARQIDLFALWSFVLLAIAAEPVLGLSRVRARFAGVVFAAVHVVLMGLWAGAGSGELPASLP